MFKDERLLNQNQINIEPEKEIVEWLISRVYCYKLIFTSLGHRIVIPPFLWAARNEFDTCPEKDGDFDLLFCEPNKFNEITCIEFKRIKYEHKSPDDRPNLNGLGKMRVLIKQGNIARRTGFYRTFIATVALINVSNIPHSNVMTKFEPTEDYKQIYYIDRYGNLDSEVGYIIIEIVQTTGKDWRRSGQINFAVLKGPTFQKQSSMVTEDFKRVYFKRAIKIEAV